MIDYYKNISASDKCVQIFTNEAAIPYLLDKPTCSKFYSMWMAGTEHNQKIFTNELKMAKPKIILLETDIVKFSVPADKLKLVKKFVEDNYTFHSKFRHWTFVKFSPNN